MQATNSNGFGSIYGPAFLAPRPFKPRCNFGHGHLWVSEDDEIYQCSTCGVMSSNWKSGDPLPPHRTRARAGQPE